MPFKATGYQYYGTMNIEIPIIDSDNVYERKKVLSMILIISNPDDHSTNEVVIDPEIVDVSYFLPHP